MGETIKLDALVRGFGSLGGCSFGLFGSCVDIIGWVVSA